MGIFRAAGYSSIIKSVPTSDGYRRADLHVVGAHLMGKDDLVVDVTVRHDFIGDARDVLRHGTLRNPDRPDQLLDQAAADKTRNYREPYARNRSLAFLPACMSTSGRIHSEFLRLLYFLADRRVPEPPRPRAGAARHALHLSPRRMQLGRVRGCNVLLSGVDLLGARARR